MEEIPSLCDGPYGRLDVRRMHHLAHRDRVQNPMRDYEVAVDFEEPVTEVHTPDLTTNPAAAIHLSGYCGLTKKAPGGKADLAPPIKLPTAIRNSCPK